jgi:hypothetical protein
VRVIWLIIAAWFASIPATVILSHRLQVRAARRATARDMDALIEAVREKGQEDRT